MNRVFSVLSAGGIHVDFNLWRTNFLVYILLVMIFLHSDPQSVVPDFCPWRSSSISYENLWERLGGVSPHAQALPIEEVAEPPAPPTAPEPPLGTVGTAPVKRLALLTGADDGGAGECPNFWELMDANINSSTAVGDHQLRLKVDPIILKVLYISGGLPDFWTINSIIKLRVCQ